MSIVMYNYWIDKNIFWDFYDKLQLYYKKHCMSYSGNPKEMTIDGIIKFSESIFQEYKNKTFIFDDNEMVDLQLFPFGEKYLIRVLENGYFFMNNYRKENWPVSECFYDNRTDIPKKHEKNYRIARLIDSYFLPKGKSFIVPIITRDRLLDFYYEKIKEWSNLIELE